MVGKLLGTALAAALCGSVPTCVSAAEPVEIATYRKLCGECHPRADRLASRFEGTEPAAGETRWQAFLSRHHAPDASDRTILIRYFRTLRTGG